MQIPGANRPTLGQGMPGGSAALPAGLPLPGGGVLGPPPGNIGAIAVPGARRAGIAQSAPSPTPLPPNVQTDPRVAAETGGGLAGLRAAQDKRQNPGSTKNITVALGVLDQVRKGKLDPKKAAKLMQGLTAGDQAGLADLVSQRNSREGKINIKELKALQELQKLPAPSDIQPHDLLSNFARDTSGLITGLPAGIGLAGAYGTRDILNATIPGRKKTSLFKDKILAPVGKSYAETYGPLFHGDVGKFAHNLHEHPVGPILDALSIVSAGVGSAGRFGAAGEAIGRAEARVAARAGERMYRGDPEKLGEWDMSRSSGTNLAGPGMYLTPSKQVAKTFAESRWGFGGTLETAPRTTGHITEVHVPHSLTKKTISADEPIAPGTPLHRAVLDALELTKADFKKAYGEHMSEAEINAEIDHIKSRFSAEELSQYPLKLRDLHDEIPGSSNDFGLSPGEFGRHPDAERAGLFDEGDGLDLFWNHLIPKLQEMGHRGVKYEVHGATKDPNLPDSVFGGTYQGMPDEHLPSHEYSFFDQGEAQQLLSGTHPEQKSALPLSQKARVAVPAFLKAGGRGSLIDLYDRRKGITHEAEIQDTMKQVQSVLDDPDLRLDRRSFKEVVADVASDVRATRERDIAHPQELAQGLPSFMNPEGMNLTAHAVNAGEIALREASDLIRAGAIYMRPAYLPNNWAGNTFMNVTHQGVLAPVNLAKSLVIDKHIGARYTRAMDKSLGANPATVVTSGKGRGYVSSLTQPAAHIMGAAADQPFRRAAFLHEARRVGIRKLSQVKDLFDRAASGDEAALRQIAEISRKAQEEIVKFGNMNAEERSVIRNLVFVYSWMRGAGRYAARFPLQHPIQTDVFQKASGPGNDYTASVMGGVPSFMSGVVPIGRGKDGNPIVINPFALNPLGTGLQLMRAAAGTIDVLRDPKSFNKYAQDDVVGLLNPLLGAYITAREGGPSVKKQLESTIAAMALVKGLKHPGSGNIYPTSRGEAVGHFTLGALYPREADAAAVKKSLERQNIGNPIALIPQEIADFKKATGKEPPYTLVIAYRKDLEDAQVLKDFQSHYADSHGASGFRNMPAQNRLEAGIDFLRKYGKIKAATVDEIEKSSQTLTTDEQFNQYANAVWNLTGVGQWKDAWNNMMRSIKGTALTRKKP